MCCLRPCHPHLHSFPERSHIFLWQGTLKIYVKGPDSHVHEHVGSATRVHITSSAVLRTVQSVTLSIAQGPLLLCTFADLKFSISPGDCELPPASFHLSIWLHLLPIFQYLLKINDLLLAAFLDLQHYYSVIIFTCIFCYLNVFPHSSALKHYLLDLYFESLVFPKPIRKVVRYTFLWWWILSGFNSPLSVEKP